MVRQFQYFALMALLCCCVGPVFADTVQPVQPGDAVVQPASQLLHRKRIAVVDFDVPIVVRHSWGFGRDADFGASRLNSVISDMFISALTNSGAFDVIERTQLDKVLAEQNLGREALLDPNTAPRIGKILGVDMILGGKLTEFGVKQNNGGGLAIIGRQLFGIGLQSSTARVSIDARLIDTTTAKVLQAETGSAENSETGLSFAGADFHHLVIAADFRSREWTQSRIGRATRDAVNQIVERILANYPIEAAVSAVLPDGTAVLNIGRTAGIKPGDKFDLVQASQVIDPATGQVIYEDRKPIGILQVIEVQDSGCKVTLLGDPEGHGLRVNEMAILRKPPIVNPKK